MKRMSLLVGGVITAAMLVQPTLASSSYTFDETRENWKTGTFYRYEGVTPNVFGFYENTAATHKANGTSGGYIQRKYDNNSTDGKEYVNYNDVAYSLVVKDGYQGRLGDLSNRTLQADVYSNNKWEDNAHARWFIGKSYYDDNDEFVNADYFISKFDKSIKLNRDGWKTESIVMKAENFLEWPNWAAGGKFEDVLSNYDDFGIQLFADTSDTWDTSEKPIAEDRYGAVNALGGEPAVVGLDNIASVPSPTALGGGALLMGVLAFRRRRGV